MEAEWQHVHGAAHHRALPPQEASGRSSFAGGDEDMTWKIKLETRRLNEVMRKLGELRAREHHPGKTYEWEASERLMNAEEEHERIKLAVWELEEYISEQDAEREKLLAVSRTMEQEAEELAEELSLMTEDQFHLSRAYQDESELLHRDFDRGHLDSQDVAERHEKRLRAMEKCLSAELKRANQEKMELTRIIDEAESMSNLRKREQHEMLVKIEMRIEESKRYVSMHDTKVAKVDAVRRELEAELGRFRECEKGLIECRAVTALAEEGQKSAEEGIKEIGRRMRARSDYTEAVRAKADAEMRRADDDIDAVRRELRMLEEEKRAVEEEKDSVLGMQVT